MPSATPSLKDPLTYQACPGAGVGPWFWCGQSRQTGEVYAWPSYGVTLLYWAENRSEWAETVQYVPEDGEVVGIGGFGWKVRWTAEARAEQERQVAFSAPVARVQREAA